MLKLISANVQCIFGSICIKNKEPRKKEHLKTRQDNSAFEKPESTMASKRSLSYSTIFYNH